MRAAEWTYQLPPAGDAAAGLEGYGALARDGKQLGKVVANVRHGDERYVVVEHSSLPGTHDLRAYPWPAVARIDHDELSVQVDERSAVQLDDDRAVTDDSGAEAVRITEVPDDPAPIAATEPAGPVDTGRWLLTGALATLASLATLGVLAVGSRPNFPGGWWWTIVALPAALWLASLAALASFVRKTYARRLV